MPKKINKTTEQPKKIEEMPHKNYEGTSLADMRQMSIQGKLGLLGDLILAKVESEQVLRNKQNDKGTVVVTDVQQKEAEGIRFAIIKFLTHPELYWTISKLKASLELETLSTTGKLTDIKTEVIKVDGTGYSGTPVKSTGKGPGLDEKLNLAKAGGQGSQLKSFGHAYVGEEATTVENTDTYEPKNDFTAVNLYFDFIDKGLIK